MNSLSGRHIFMKYAATDLDHFSESTLHTIPLIEAKHLNLSFGKQQVLENVSLNIHPKEIVTLIGPNGAGKSTLLKILLGLLTPDSGKVVRKRHLNVGFMPQKIQIDPTLPMTVERFLQLGLKIQKRGFFRREYSTTNLEKYVDELNIGYLLKQPIQQVSGGEMQRILLARALLREPDLLVLDEPVQGVDLQGQTELYQYLNQLRHREGYGILMVSHDLHIVMKHTDEVLCLNRHMCCSGHPHSVSQSKEFQDLFGEHTEAIAVYEHHHDEATCDHSHGHNHIHLDETGESKHND
ncbi:ATP-binding cassette domain-containing protein [Thiomicrorhabdus heinhorstiae]|nr:ATP-binding cassette domain-containing protein [Thiomicrorhabdus heinhorstiae]